MALEPREVFLAQFQEVEFVLENDPGVEQSVLYDKVAGLHLLLGERYLREVVLPFVRVVLRAVQAVVYRVLHSLRRRYRVALPVGELRHVVLRHHRAVHALPVVNVLAPPPQFLERRLSLVHRHLVVEIPLAVLHLLLLLRVLVHVPTVSLVGSLLLLRLLLGLREPFLLLLLLQGLYHPVDGSIAVGLRHFCQRLQRVLQMHCLGERHELVEYLRAFREGLVVLAVLVEQSYRLAVAPLRVGEFLPRPVQVAEPQQQHAFLHPGACRLLVARLVCLDGLRRVAVGEVYVSHGVIHLVEIFLVVV